MERLNQDDSPMDKIASLTSSNFFFVSLNSWSCIVYSKDLEKGLKYQQNVLVKY